MITEKQRGEVKPGVNVDPTVKIATKSKRLWREPSFRRLTKKNICEIPSTTNKVINVHVDLP